MRLWTKKNEISECGKYDKNGKTNWGDIQVENKRSNSNGSVVRLN